MTIQRWTTAGQYGATVYVDQDNDGAWVLHKDYLSVVEQLEYDIRYYREQTQDLQEELQLIKDERNYYQDKFNELYEQTS